MNDLTVLAVTAPCKGPTLEQRERIRTGYHLLMLMPLTFVSGFAAIYLLRNLRHSGNFWCESHGRYQLRTFWICMVWSGIGWMTAFLLVGYPILIFSLYLCWMRCLKGLHHVDQSSDNLGPDSWLI